jgi:glycine/D-amino acid oxidase-like deaminating enzyme
METHYLQSSRTEGLHVSLLVESTRAGNLLLGSSREFIGFQREPSPEVVQHILQRIVRFFPDLETIQIIRIYTGFRPHSPDRLPFIGPVPSVPGLYLATGHEGAGICLAPATAALLASYLTGTPPPIHPTPFAPDGRLAEPGKE